MILENDALHLYEEGRRLMAAGSLEAAAGVLRESAALDPHFKTLELLGECLLALDRPAEAIVPLAAATALNAQVRAPALLAQALFRHGDLTRAWRIAQLALQRDPANRMAREIAEKTAGHEE